MPVNVDFRVTRCYDDRQRGDQGKGKNQSFHGWILLRARWQGVRESRHETGNCSENRTGADVETLERYQQSRRVIEDFSARTLAAIPTEFGKLLYLASLRDLASGVYFHEGLSALYPGPAVQQGLQFCHEELFFRILELPLEQQEGDLRLCISGLEGEFWGKVSRWKQTELHRLLVPSNVPAYLRELFHANVGALLQVLLEEHASLHPDA